MTINEPHSVGKATMADITATATDSGTVLLTVTSDSGQQGQAELPIEMAEKLKAQIETALVSARLRQIDAALTSAFAAQPSLHRLAGKSALLGEPQRREVPHKHGLWALLHPRG
jgi:hypothetical protein